MTKDDMDKNNNGAEKEKNSEASHSPELPEPTESALEMEDLQKQIDQYKDLLLRKAAEFDNYKRRAENETANIVKYANESFVEDLLPVIDDIERSIKHIKEGTDYEALVKGVDLIHQKLIKVLDAHNVRTFETLGKEFSVDYHDAMMQIPRDDVPPHTVIEEVQKGYTMNDRVIRHAKVIVSCARGQEDKPAVQNESSETGKGDKG